MRMRSGGTTAVCVLAIVLGALGWATSAVGLAGLVFGKRTQQAVAAMQTLDPELGRIQAEMNGKMLAVADRFKWMTAAVLTVNVALATALVVGGARGLKLKPAARKLLLGAFAAGMIFELARIWPAWLVLRETQAITNEYMPRIIDASLPRNAKAPPGFKQLMQAIFMVMGKAQIAMIVGQALVKFVYYALSWRFLRSPAAWAEFEPVGDDGASASGESIP